MPFLIPFWSVQLLVFFILRIDWESWLPIVIVVHIVAFVIAELGNPNQPHDQPR